MTNRDVEIESWRAAWTSSSEASSGVPAEVRRKAVQQQRRLRTQHIAELGTAVALLVFSAALARKNPTAEGYLWAALVWAGTIVATAFSLWNWHILWDADLKSVLEFTELYRKRCLAGLRATRFGERFLVVQVAISAPWLTLDYLRHRMIGTSYAISMVLLAGLTAGFVILFGRFRRRASQQLKELDGMNCE